MNYFTIKLGQYFQLNDIIRPIIRRLRRFRSIAGFRFIFSGRLTRKERAAFIVRSHKSMPLSTRSIRVDYAADSKTMKYGVVGIRVLLLIKSFSPYYYFFEFRNNV